MPIPLYFAIQEKDSVNLPNFPVAQCGCSFSEGGTLHLPGQMLPDILLVLDDSTLPQALPKDADFARLLQCCTRGCLLDFERQPTKIHAAIIEKIGQLLPNHLLFAAPERYIHPRLLPLIPQPSKPVSWTDFVRSVHQKHPQGWMLELIPCNHRIRLPFSKTQSGYLSEAICCYRQNGAQVHYYDTKQTISKKVDVASRYGCHAAIGLYGELMAMSS